MPQNIKAPQATNSTADQRSRILSWLQQGKHLTTIKARDRLDIMHPAARIMELKRAGYKIETVWRNDLTEQGKPHRVACYILTGGGADGKELGTISKQKKY